MNVIRVDKKRVIACYPRRRRLYSRLGYQIGKTIARCPVIALSREETKCIKRTAWGRYLFHLEDGSSLFCIEYGSLCISNTYQRRQHNAQALYDPNKWSGRGALKIMCSSPIAPGSAIRCSSKVLVQEDCMREERVFYSDNEVKESPGKGLGVFALKNFNRNQILERVPVLVTSSNEAPYIYGTILIDYCRYWGHGVHVMPLGFWAFHNTTKTCDNTNAIERDDHKQRLTTIHCIRPIREGDEITIPYVKEAMKGTPLI